MAALKISDQDADVLYIQRTEIKHKNEANKTIYTVREFPKTESSVAGIYLSESAIKVLSFIKELNMKNGIKSEFIFYEHEYGRLKSYFFNKTLKKICMALGIEYRSMHKLRKTYASYLLANGVEEKVAQLQLRHKNSSTTHKYYEFSIRSREYRLEMLNRNDILCRNRKV